MRGLGVGGSAVDFVRGVGFLFERGFVRGFETADEEFAAVGDVDVDVAVHGVFAE